MGRTCDYSETIDIIAHICYFHFNFVKKCMYAISSHRTELGCCGVVGCGSDLYSTTRSLSGRNSAACSACGCARLCSPGKLVVQPEIRVVSELSAAIVRDFQLQTACPNGAPRWAYILQMQTRDRSLCGWICSASIPTNWGGAGRRHSTVRPDIKPITLPQCAQSPDSRNPEKTQTSPQHGRP